MKDLLIGIDIGTMGIRSIVYDVQLNEISKSYMPYPLIKISEKEIEQDAFVWWELTQKTVAESAAQAEGRVRAIGISSQGIALVPVDRNAVPLRNAISWLDSRADRQLEEILDAYPEKEIYHITGKRAASFYTLPKILWLKENEPEIYEKTYKLLLPHDYIAARLCGEFFTDHTMASGTMVYDIGRQEWSEEMLERFALDGGKLPEICRSAAAIGRIRRDVAESLGLPRDVWVCAGGQDQKCAAFGAGIGDGIATVSLGTAAAIEKKWTYPHRDRDMRIPCFSFLFENSWVTEGVLSTAAASLRWLKETFFEDWSYERMSRMVEDETQYKTELLFYPHLAGCATPDWYKDTAGVYYGIHLNTTREDFVRALFEGVAMQIRSNLEAMGNIDELRVFGGGSNSGAWCGMIADITGSVVKIPHTSETACMGAAMLAGMSCGLFSDASQAEKNVSMARVYLPDTARSAYYDEKYMAYKGVEKKLWE